jgi:hypothetical protein
MASRIFVEAGMTSKHNPDRFHRAGFRIPISAFFEVLFYCYKSTRTKESASPKSGSKVCVLTRHSISFL